MKPMNFLAPLALLLPLMGWASEVPRSDKPKKPSLTIKLPEYQLDSKDFIFPSGLRIIMQADHSEPVVGVTAWNDRGSSDDPVGKEGIAHFVEHLWFRSEHQDLPKIWNVLSDLGCSLNAFTADDNTTYMSVCPIDALPGLMRLESLRLTAAVEGVTEDTVNVEREVIRNELRMRKENGFMGAIPYLIEKLYPPDHPYARGGIGSHESLNNCKLSDIQKFVKDNYTAHGATIVVVGDFDPEHASDLIFENMDPVLFDPRLADIENPVQRFPKVADADPDDPDDWLLWAVDPENPTAPLKLLKDPPVRIKGPPPIPPNPNDITISYAQAPVEHRTVFVGWTLPGSYRGNDGVIQTVAGIANYFMADYLSEQTYVRADEYGNKQIGCFPWASELDTKVLCMVEIKDSWKDKVDGNYVANRMLDQVAMIWNPDLRQPQPGMPMGVLEYQFNTSKQYSLASVLQNLDLFASLSGRQTEIAQHAHYTGSAKYHSDLMNQIMKLNASQVSEMAFTWLKRDRAVRIVLDPIPEEERLLDSSESEYHGATKDGDMLISAFDPNKISDQTILDTIITPNLDDITDITLDNGLRVVIMPHGEVPIIEASLIFGGGEKSEPLGLDDFSWAMSSTVSDKAHDPLQIAGFAGIGGGATWTRDNIRASSGNLDGALWLLRERVDNRKPDFDGKVRWIKAMKSSVLTSWGDQDWWSQHERWQHLNPGHPIHWEASYADFEKMKDISQGQVKEYLATQLQPKNTTLLITGSLDVDQAIAQAKTYFGGWQARPEAKDPHFAELPPPNPPEEGSPVYLFDDPKNTQTSISYVCRIQDRTTNNEATMHVMGDVLDERAWQILREQSGVTYGAGAGAWTYPSGDAYLYMQSLVQNDASVLAVNTFRKLVEETTEGKFEADRVKLLKYNRAKKYVLKQQSIGQMHSFLQGAITLNEPFTSFQDYANNLAKVDGAALKGVMGNCKDNAVVTVTGPLKYVEPVFKDAGIDYEVLDWDAMGDELYAEADPKAYKKYKKDQAKKEKKDAKKKTKEGDEDEDDDGDEAEIPGLH